MVIVDTTVWVDYLRGTLNSETNWLDLELPHQPLGLTDLILCEVLQGIRDDRVFARTKQQFEALQLFETGGSDLAIMAAENFRKLRKKGHTVRKTIDCLIASFCIRDGHALLHRDRDFDIFERVLGLKVIHPQD